VAENGIVKWVQRRVVDVATAWFLAPLGAVGIAILTAVFAPLLPFVSGLTEWQLRGFVVGSVMVAFVFGVLALSLAQTVVGGRQRQLGLGRWEGTSENTTRRPFVPGSSSAWEQNRIQTASLEIANEDWPLRRRCYAKVLSFQALSETGVPFLTQYENKLPRSGVSLVWRAAGDTRDTYITIGGHSHGTLAIAEVDMANAPDEFRVLTGVSTGTVIPATCDYEIVAEVGTEAKDCEPTRIKMMLRKDRHGGPRLTNVAEVYEPITPPSGART